MRTSLVLVRAVAGLEWVVAEEVTAAGHRVVEVSKRQVVVDGDVEPPRVADDLFVVYGVMPDPGRTRAGLVGAVRRALDVPVDRRAFAVSASFSGARNFNRYDVEDLVGERLARLTGGRYHSRRYGVVPPDDRAEWRVVLDGKTLWIARRPYAVPLHRRPWRQRTVQGSLHPPVAAAIARLADLAAGHDVLDPFCGAGTILLEAQQLEPAGRYVGVDRDPAAVAAARSNAVALRRISRAEASRHFREAAHTRGSAGARWRLGDARHVDGVVDRVVTNPPWGRQLVTGDLPSAVRRWRKVLRPGGLLVAILMPEQADQLTRGWRIEARYDVSVAGRHPVIVVAGPSRC